MAVAALMADASVRNQVFLERLKAGEVGKFDAYLRKMDKEITAVLRGPELTEFARKRLEATLAEVRTMLATIYGQYTTVLQGDLFELAEYEAALEARALAKSIKGFVPNVPSANQAWAAVSAAPLGVAGSDVGKMLQPFIKDWTVSEGATVVGIIRQGAFEGQTNAQILQRVRGTAALRYTDGQLAVAKRHAEAVVRTSVQHVASEARSDTWARNSDVVTGYRWVSTLDSRTTVQCQALDGRVFQSGKGPMPPAHINCRSTTVAELDPAFSFLKRGAERASKDGPVSANQSYYGWLKTQPASFQDAALGKTRGELFRDGGLSAERFAQLQLDRNFQPLTLEQMKLLEPIAFERAGIE